MKDDVNDGESIKTRKTLIPFNGMFDVKLCWGGKIR
jgi:hypothetical protein